MAIKCLSTPTHVKKIKAFWIKCFHNVCFPWNNPLDCTLKCEILCNIFFPVLFNFIINLSMTKEKEKKTHFNHTKKSISYSNFHSTSTSQYTHAQISVSQIQMQAAYGITWFSSLQCFPVWLVEEAWCVFHSVCCKCTNKIVIAHWYQKASAKY